MSSCPFPATISITPRAPICFMVPSIAPMYCLTELLGVSLLYFVCPRYDGKQSDSEASIQEVWEIKSIPSFPLLLGPL